MSFAGIPCTTILKIKNNTESSIDCINFIYDSNEISTKIKNIKPHENKQTGIRTLYDVTDLKMMIGTLEKTYLIKNKIPKGYCSTITISINQLNATECEFEVGEE